MSYNSQYPATYTEERDMVPLEQSTPYNLHGGA